MNIFRLPLNAVVVSGTDATEDVFEHYKVYGMVSGLLLLAAAFQTTLAEGSQEEKKQTKKE
jgi:hypothetical protein